MTLLVGNNVHNGANSAAQPGKVTTYGFDAVVTGTASEMSIQWDNTASLGANFRMAIYSSADILLGETAAFTKTDTLTAPLTVPLLNGVSIVAGTTYFLAFFGEGGVDMFGDSTFIRGRNDYNDLTTFPTAGFPSDISAQTSGYSTRAAPVLYASSAPTPTTRKGSTFVADKTGTLGTVTTATLNGVNVFDHLTAQDATTATFAGAFTDEITTSGEYSLVLGDGTVTETTAVQVSVYGVAPSNNPLQKDGSALASLTGVQTRVTSGANINGTELYYSGTATTDASGNLSNIDLSSTSAADADPVLLHMRTAAGDSIIAAETVGLI